MFGFQTQISTKHERKLIHFRQLSFLTFLFSGHNLKLEFYTLNIYNEMGIAAAAEITPHSSK